MKWLRMAMMSALLLITFTCTVHASSAETILNEQWDASGMGTLYESLPDETKALLKRLGVEEWSWEAVQSMTPQTVWSALRDMLYDASGSPLMAVFTALCGILVFGVYQALCTTALQQSPLVRMIGILAVTSPLLIPLWQTVERVSASANSASVFCLSFAPVYAGVLAAQGNGLSAVSYQAVMLAAAEGISVLIGSIIVPLLGIALALGLAGNIQSEHRIGDIAAAINKTAVWLLGISMTVFVGMLSLRGVVAATADSIGGRMMRFSVAGFVPVVGGSLSEALYTVRGCLAALRGTIGSLGVLTVVLIVLPTWLECVVWGWLLFLAKTTAALFGFSELEGTLLTAQGVVRTLNGILASLAMLMIISVTILSLAGGG